MRKSAVFFLLSFVSLHFLQAQKNAKVFYSIDEALSQPDKVEKFYLDCEAEDDSLFFVNLKRFPELKSLTIVAYSGERLPEKLFLNSRLDSLYISECSDLNFSLFFRDLVSCRQLNCLVIDECDLLEASADLAQLPELTKLVITNCENLNLERTIANIAGCKNLKYLGLPVNRICEIPANISLVSQIEVLDISNNFVFDLPESMASLNNLQTFSMEGNIFINPVNSLAKINPLKIKLLSLDNDLTDTDRERLKQLFPNTAIIEKETAPLPEDADTINLTPENTGDSVQYGVFKTIAGETRIFSEAYLHYADIFNSPRLSFDSLLFDERFRNLSYANVYRINIPQMPINSNIVQLFNWKKRWMKKGRNKVAFNFYYRGEPYPPNTILMNKELMAFRGMYWVYDGDLEKKEVMKKYELSNRKTASFNNSNSVAWNDARIYYDDVIKTFTIELKTLKGIESFAAHPVLESTKHPELSKDQYYKRYTRYVNSLDSRRKRFNKRLLKEKATFNKNFGNQSQNLWKAFSDNYFSDYERQMTQNQWLEYYDRVIGSEKQAYDGAPVTPDLMKRYLAINKYVENLGGANFVFDSIALPYPVNFYDTGQIKLVVQSVFVLNTMNKIYLTSPGSLAFNPTNLSLGKSSNVAIIVFLRNGNVGVLHPDKYSGINLLPGESDIHVEVFDYKLITFGQLSSFIGL